MLRLNPFELKIPENLHEASNLLVQTNGKARILAGGTDLLPNLKHRIYGDVPLLVSLKKIATMKGIQQKDNVLSIGAGERLATIAQNRLIHNIFPALALAAGNVASPQIRNMATLGGNLCLDTRCTFINQTEFWRGALGGCLKADGDICHVVSGGRNCVAAFSGDMAIALIALDTSVELFSAMNTRTIKLAELYNADGAKHLNLNTGEILTRIHIPIFPERRLAFRKWSVRKSIDFPLVNVAIRVDEEPDGKINGMAVVVGVLASRPRVLNKFSDFCAGKVMDENLAAEIGEAVYRKCRPLPNVPYDHLYRREMLRTQAKRAAMCLIAGHEMQVREG